MSDYELRKTLSFESAHRLPHVPAGHKCGRLHGHSFKVTLILRGPLAGQSGWVVDYTEIKAAAQPLIDQLDHNYLNDIQGLENPTSEILAKWIFDKLSQKIKGLYQVIISETCTTESRFPVR